MTYLEDKPVPGLEDDAGDECVFEVRTRTRAEQQLVHDILEALVRAYPDPWEP